MIGATVSCTRTVFTVADLPDSWAQLDSAPERDTSIDLVLRSQNGDVDALDQLCTRYLPRLRRWAHGRLPAPSRGLLDTEDLAQEVLVHTVRRIPAFDPRHGGAFRAYVRQALLNRLRDEGRKGLRQTPPAALDENLAGEDTSPLDAAIGRQAIERYEAALQRLSQQDRELIIAKLELGFSASELAAEFGKPSPAAAHMAVSRAVVRLAKEMGRA